MAELKFPILKVTDFVGEFSIALNTFKELELTTIIAFQEKKLVRDLLSDKAYKDLVTGVDLPEYNKLFNETIYVDSNGYDSVNQGFIVVLKYLIKAYYLKTNYRNTIIGTVKTNNDNVVSASDGVNTGFIYQIYNNGVTIYNNDVMKFISEKESIYPIYEDFNANNLEYLYL